MTDIELFACKACGVGDFHDLSTLTEHQAACGKCGDDFKARARAWLAGRDYQRAQGATDAEGVLRRRVWTLRPALQLAIKRLREVYPHYEDAHDGGEIMRVIEIGDKALADTAGSTTTRAEVTDDA
jgi:hypothetical protein